MIYNINPHTKPRMVRSDSWKKRKCVLKYWAFKDEIRAAGVTIPDKCYVIFNVPMPRSWSKKKRNDFNLQPHQTTPDIDNLLKALFDAVFDDDSHIYEVYKKKQWAEVGSIEIGEIEKEVLIF